MADPTKYTVTFDFSGFQAANPTEPLPGSSADNEFHNIATSIDEIVEALKEVRRSDGALVNGIVTMDSLSSEVSDALNGSSAYEVAVDNGFVGTEAAWLASLEGDAATIAVGTVTTGAPGTSATVTNAGTSSAAVLNFTIPRGAQGEAGDGSGDMLAATYDPQDIGGDAFDVDNHTDGTTNKVYTATEKMKLAGVATGATANSADSTLLNRSNHTGAQAISTVTGLQTALDAKQGLNANLTTIAGLTLGATGTALLDDANEAAARTTIAAAARTQTECIAGVIVAPAAGELVFLNRAPHGGTITNVRTGCATGTCTATFKINGTALGGTANSVSSTWQNQPHSTANVFNFGDYLSVTLSSVSSPTYMHFTIEYTRTLS